MSAPGSPPWSQASAPIWALTSGYASPIRVDKPLAFLQAFIDDSVGDQGDQRLFMAGYLNRAEKWALFSDAWQEELNAKPSIKYLKMVEANGLRGPFAGWSGPARDEKLRSLARVIRHFEPLSFQFSISREQYFRLVRPFAPRGLGSPHFSCCFSVISGLARYVDSQKINIPIDFIFDQQSGVDADIGLFFEHMKSNLPKGARKLIAGTPSFKDDKLFLPLQAADMLAWHLRREHEACIPPETLPVADLLRSSDCHLASEITEAVMRSWGEQFSKLPAISMMQGKPQWQSLRRDLSGLLSRGFVPPHGSRFKNALYGALARVLRQFPPKL